MTMTEWEYNHKVTCNNCIHSIVSCDFVDGLGFRTDVKCELGYETDYRIPFKEYWDCKEYEEWTYLKAIIKIIKKVFKRGI